VRKTPGAHSHTLFGKPEGRGKGGPADAADLRLWSIKVETLVEGSHHKAKSESMKGRGQTSEEKGGNG